MATGPTWLPNFKGSIDCPSGRGRRPFPSLPSCPPRPFQPISSATRSFPFTLAPFATTAKSDGLDRPTRYCLSHSSVGDFLTSDVTCVVRYPDNLCDDVALG